jgi:hypothetical protein
MQMWGRSKQHQNAEAGGEEFEAAAARVSAEVEAGPVPGAAAVEVEGEGESLEVRPEWAEAAARLCFLPAARIVHPAYALADEEAEIISPKMQAFLQAIADKYAPAAFSRVANKYPEFLDLAGALGVLYWQKWRYVSKLREMEAAARAEGREVETKPAPSSIDLPGVSLPLRQKAGERTPDGVLVI